MPAQSPAKATARAFDATMMGLCVTLSILLFTFGLNNATLSKRVLIE